MSSLPGLSHSGEAVVLRLSGSPENVRTARLVAVAAGRRVGMPEDCLDEVRIGVGEAVTWAVQRAPWTTVELVMRATAVGDFSVAVGWPEQPVPGAVEPVDSLALALLKGLADQVSVGDDGVRLVWEGAS